MEIRSLLERSLPIVFLICFSISAFSNGKQQSRYFDAADTSKANNFYLLGIKHGENAQYDSSIYFFEKASLIYQKMDYSNRYVACINKIGQNYQRKNDYQKALDILNEALRFCNLHLSEYHPETAVAYNNIGNTFLSKGDLKQAEDYYKLALEIRIKYFGEWSASVAKTYENLGLLYNRKVLFRIALDYYYRALDIYYKIDDLRSKHIAYIHNRLAVAFIEMKDFHQAERHLRIAINSYKEVFGLNHVKLAILYFNMGIIFSYQNDFDTALQYITKSLTIFRQNYSNEFHEKFAIIYNLLAISYQKQKMNSLALEYYEKVLDIREVVFDNYHPKLAETYTNIGFVYNSQENPAKALDYYKKAMKIFNSTISSNHQKMAKIHLNLGNSYLKLKNLQKSHEHLTISLTISSKNLIEKHEDISSAHLTLGDIELFNENPKAALYHYQSAIIAAVNNFSDTSIYANPPFNDIVSNQELLKSLAAKANAFWLMSGLENSKDGDLTSAIHALETYEVTAQLVDHIRNSFKGERSKYILGETAYDVFDDAIEVARALYLETGEIEYLGKAFYFSEKAKSQVLANALSESRARHFANIPDSLVNQERELRIDQAFYNTRLQKAEQENDTTDTEKYQNKLFDLNREYDALLTRFEEQYPEYFSLKFDNSQPVVKEIQDSLSEESALIEYFVGKKHTHIFLISRNEFSMASIPSDSSLSSLVDAYNKSIRKDSEMMNFPKYSHRLYQALLQPIEPGLKGKKRLLVIPDGTLSRVSFEALVKQLPEVAEERVDFSELAYIIRDFEIKYHYSANLWYKSDKETPVGSHQYDFAGFAPVFSNRDSNNTINNNDYLSFNMPSFQEIWDMITRDGRQFMELFYSEEETASIVAIFEGQSKTGNGYFHQEASEENFKKEARNYRHLHLATHSFVNEDRPQLSGIAFSQPIDSTASDDGILYPDEIYNLDINADLVVLSSCESGVGKAVKGEGLLALTRGFLYAGTSNIIASLWKVSDRQTSKLMLQFYEQYLSGKRYSSALRDSKLAMIKDPFSAYPMFWAGFVLVGP